MGDVNGRAITVVGAASSIGIRPYDDGRARHLDRAPEALRATGLIGRLGARDVGDVAPPAYVDFTRVGKKPRNEDGVLRYSHALGRTVARAAADGAFVLVLGGDCSILLGSLLGVRQATRERLGLVYIDAHSDFATPEESVTGSVAAMAPAMAVGRGDSPLASLADGGPLVAAGDVVMIGRRDDDQGDIYGQAALKTAGVLELPNAEVKARGPEAIAHMALSRLENRGARRFWIHVDADVLDPSVMPAVDSPEPDGLSVDALLELLRPLVRHPGGAGLELTIYDPHLDPDGSGAATLGTLLERALQPRVSAPIR